MAYTLQDLITDAAIMVGILAIGETLDGAVADYALIKANHMVDLWASDRLTIFRRQRAGGFALVSGTASYSIGTGATWNVARPLWIDGAGIVVNPAATYPAELEMEVLTTHEWQEVVTKTVQSGLPRKIWYDRTFANGTIYVNPVPNTATPQIVLYLPIAVTEFTALTDTISLPPGYRMALVSNLAVLMGLGVREIPPEIQALATLSLGKIKSVNLVAQIDPLECDEAVLPAAGGGHFNFYSGSRR